MGFLKDSRNWDLFNVVLYTIIKVGDLPFNLEFVVLLVFTGY